MITIMLYGFLGQKFGKVHRYDVKSPAEAVRALSATIPGFRKSLADGGAYRVLIGGSSAIDKTELHNPISEKESLRIVPVIAGAGNAGKIILGIVLVVVGVWTGNQYATQMGVGLIIGGVSGILFAAPSIEDGGTESPNNKPSYSFNGAVNTAAQGNPVPICYGGPIIVGSQVISAGLSVEPL